MVILYICGASGGLRQWSGERLNIALERLLEADEEFYFYTGGMGEFDAMSARAVRVLKQHHPEKKIHLYLVLLYMKHSFNEDKLLKTLYDEIIIPMELAECHYKGNEDGRCRIVRHSR